MPTPFLGEVRLFTGNFAPAGWAFCNGQILSIGQNTALFSLLSNRFGGDGISTFALPDFRGRIPLHVGQGPGLSLRGLAQAGGTESHLLTTAEIPEHTHSMSASSANGTSDSPAAKVPARSPASIPMYGPTADANQAAAAAGPSGGGLAHNNMAPYLTVSFIIALQGVFPSHP